MDGREWTTSILNLMETYYAVLKDGSEEDAERVWLAFRRQASGLADEDIKEGMRSRLRLRGRRINLSYTDAVGYAAAQRIGARFVTGDRAFSGLPHVEFVRH